MHGNQWVLKIAVLKYYSVSKRGTTAKSNPKQATDPISLHTKFGDNSSNSFPLNERKPCVTPDIGRRTPDIGQRTSDGEKSKNNISTPQGGGHNNSLTLNVNTQKEPTTQLSFMTMYKHKAQIKQCTNIVPNICNIQCTNIVSNICNTVEHPQTLKVLLWQQILPDTPKNLISSRSSWGKHPLKIW